MQNLFILIDEHNIQMYNNEILKRMVDDKIVKVIANPTEQDLKEFGYMECIRAEETPEYDAETQCAELCYEVRGGKLVEYYKVTDLS